MEKQINIRVEGGTVKILAINTFMLLGHRFIVHKIYYKGKQIDDKLKPFTVSHYKTGLNVGAVSAINELEVIKLARGKLLYSEKHGATIDDFIQEQPIIN